MGQRSSALGIASLQLTESLFDPVASTLASVCGVKGPKHIRVVDVGKGLRQQAKRNHLDAGWVLGVKDLGLRFSIGGDPNWLGPRRGSRRSHRADNTG
tara:strand:+ start:2862 stop:3155 length:294 start_codon:yes stop_codon:yes gene_type:complete